jgi:hypothetical protein
MQASPKYADSECTRAKNRDLPRRVFLPRVQYESPVAIIKGAAGLKFAYIGFM